MTTNRCTNRAVKWLTTADDDSWYWGVPNITAVCRAHLSTARAEHLRTAEDLEAVNVDRVCEAKWST